MSLGNCAGHGGRPGQKVAYLVHSKRDPGPEYGKRSEPFKHLCSFPGDRPHLLFGAGASRKANPGALWCRLGKEAESVKNPLDGHSGQS